MKALIYIELIENITHHYEKEILQWARLKYPDLSIFDFDNFSDSSMAQYALQLLEASENSMIIIESATDTAGGLQILGFAEKILKNKQKVTLILNGENKQLVRMFSLLNRNFNKDLDIEAQKKIMADFFA